ATGRFVYAAKRLSTAQRYFEQAGLTRDMGYLKSIASQGLLFTSMGRFSQAEKFTSRALDMRQERLGKTNISVAASLNNYAVLHYNLGQYNESENEFRESSGLIELNNQKDAMPYAILLNNQAILYQSIGRYEQAVALLKQALQLAGTIEVTKARYHLKFFSNLALLYQQMGKYAEAEEIYRGLEKKLERNTPEFANFLNNVAILAMLMKKEDRVEQMLKQSAEIYKSTLTENSPAYAKVICDLGNFYRYKGRYAEAAPLLEQALQIREETLGTDHPLFVQTEEDLAVLKWKNNDLGAAIPLFHTVMLYSLDFINLYFPPISEAEKTRYWDLLAPRFERFYNFAIEASAQNKELLSEMFAYRMATKGLLLSSTKKVSESILNSGNSTLVRDYSEWLDSKELLTTLYAYSKEDLREQNINIDSLEQVTNAMEKRLSQNSSEFSKLMFASKTGPADLKKVLGPEDALVEMIRIRKFDQVFTDQVLYVALVLTRDMSAPDLVLMNSGNDMEGKYAKTYRLSMKNKVNDVQSFENYWARVEPQVKGKKKIFFSPDGVYNQINLYTLKKSGGDYLINQYDIVLIGNPRDLVTHESRNQMDRGKNATLLGFPDYGGGGLIVQLPGTKTEVDAIQKLLKSSGYQVSELVQREATETNLKSSRRVSILHIATHGYFLQDVDKASWPIGVHAEYAKSNVLLRLEQKLLS
ncbi:MAG: tetratricopeptide repeat protein, partial [Chitinophagaceae bacterium]